MEKIYLIKEKDAPPLYIQIEKILALKIEKGIFEKGSIIPSEKQLQEQFSVSRMTVRLAIAELSKKNYVECMRGIGTVVTYGKIQDNSESVKSFTQEMMARGIELETSFCEVKAFLADETVAKLLQVEKGTKLTKLTRLRKADSKPFVYSETYLNIDNLPLDEALYKHSLYEFLKKEYNTQIVGGNDVLEAVTSTKKTSEMLNLKNGMPLFKRTRLSKDKSGKFIELSFCYYPGDRYKYSVKL